MPVVARPKKTLSRAKRCLRAILSILDPRAWAHLLKLVNYYNYSHVSPRRDLNVGADAAISPTVSFANGGRITLGAAPHLGAGCFIWAGTAEGSITAGNNLLLGPGVVLTATTYRFDDGTPVTRQLMDERPITIGNDVWIGANAVILPGARIGNGAIVGAGAVITGFVKAGAIVAGVPARQIGTRQAVVGGGDKA